MNHLSQHQKSTLANLDNCPYIRNQYPVIWTFRLSVHPLVPTCLDIWLPLYLLNLQMSSCRD